MVNYISPTRKMFAATTLTALLLFSAATVLAQAPPEWPRALELYESQNFVAALPLLENVAKGAPDEPKVLSRLGFALYAVAATQKDPKERRRMFERALEVLKRSKANGDTSNLTEIALDALSSGDDLVPASQIKSAETALREGEAAFVRGDFDAAIKAYKHALNLDPKLYAAALYAGDSEFKKAYLSKDPQFRREHFEQAGIWFSKAIAIDENRETAHRYWGDALDVQGKTEEARAKFVEAIVAEPYNRKGYVGLTQWAERHQVSMAHPKVVIPAKVASDKSGKVDITLDDGAFQHGQAGTTAWMAYGLTRAGWMNGNGNGSPSEKFSRAHPGETSYRHSLAEEAEALKMVATSASEELKKTKVTDVDQSLANLIKLRDAGLLEAYVLFARVDEGIARDYDAYRKANRDKLRRYWLEIVISQ